MKNLNSQQLACVSGGIKNVEACQIGTAVAGGIIGGAAGFYATFGFGTGAGASWGMTAGGMVGTAFCSTFFED